MRLIYIMIRVHKAKGFSGLGMHFAYIILSDSSRNGVRYNILSTSRAVSARKNDSASFDVRHQWQGIIATMWDLRHTYPNDILRPKYGHNYGRGVRSQEVSEETHPAVLGDHPQIIGAYRGQRGREAPPQGALVGDQVLQHPAL